MTKLDDFSNSGNELVTKKFPIEVFPKELLEVIINYCSSLNINIDYACAVVLFTFASAIGSSYKLRIKSGWIELPSLYCALVGKPGINKSSPISLFTKPLYEIDSFLYRDFKNKWKEFSISKQSKDENKISLEEPKRKQVVIQDFTQEALFQALYHNPHGFAIICDEITSLLKSMNKYRSGNGGDLEMLLSLFSFKPISVNRKNSEPLLIENPFCGIIGSIQPQVLVQQFGGNAIDNGLTHRFLFVYPDDVKREDLSENDISKESEELYNLLIKSLIDPNKLLNNIHQPRTIILSKEAMNIYKNFRRRINDIINNENSDAVSGIYAKMDTYFFRLALIIHIIRLTCLEKDLSHLEISECSAQRAVALIDYFEYMALKVFKLLEKHRDPLMNYALEHKILYYQLPQQFTTEEAIMILKQSSVKTSERTLFNLLSDQYLFTKIRRGFYEKIW